MLKLYEISESYENMQNLLEDDIDNERFKKVLDTLDDEFEDKAEGLAKVIRNLDASAKAYKEEEKRMSTRRRAIENNIQSLKQYLEYEMVRVDKTQFDTELFKFNIQKNSPSVTINEGVELPEEYYKVTKTPDKAKLKNDLQDGKEIEGVSLQQSESLRIR